MDLSLSEKDWEARVAYLEEENRFTIDALEMAAAFGDFQSSLLRRREPLAIIKETESRARKLIPFETAAFYLVNEANGDFTLAHCEPELRRNFLQEEIDFLIETGTFAWALREKRAVWASSRDFQFQMVLHVAATQTRIRGMFVGVLAPGQKNIPGVSLSLLSVILLSSANALENFELYRMVLESHDQLENRVRERTLELGEANRKLQQEIAEHWQSAEALQKSEERYRFLVENAPVGILTVDAAGRIADVNPMLAHLLGFSSIEGAWGANVLSIPVLADSGLTRDLFACFETKKPGTFERSYVNPQGQETFLRCHLVPLLDPLRPEIGVQAIVEDISETRRLAARLQQAQKMEIIGTLAGGVAHDLNNILSGLVSYPDLLLMELPANDPLGEIALTIKKSGERAAAVVQDLLTLARRGVAIREVVNLNQVIEEYFQTPEHKKLISLYPQVRFETHLGESLFKISGSPVHLSKLVGNLVSNAAESMTGSGKVRIETANICVDKPLQRFEEVKPGEYIVLSVSDDGSGIPAKDLPRIFEPFYTKKVMGRSGTGLGLAVVLGTVKDHKGCIDVHSSEGKGTRFDLYFPINRLEEDKSRKGSLCVEDLRGQEKILVVDDVPEQREIASLILARLGYRMATASSGEEAIVHLQHDPVDLVVLDMILEGGMDGLETYQKILDLHPGQKAILVSGYAETDRVQQALRLGAGAYVRKPYVLEKIGTAVRKELDKSLLSPNPT
jgi:two-component system, cell cycle sensor histidine kinase and response regulator CckA